MSEEKLLFSQATSEDGLLFTRRDRIFFTFKDRYAKLNGNIPFPGPLVADWNTLNDDLFSLRDFLNFFFQNERFSEHT